MIYIGLLLLLCGVLGFVSVAVNPAPLYAALGLVVSAAMICGLLVGLGASFISLVLFLIYLGGMLVVFAYSVALSVEPYPLARGDSLVLFYVIGLIGVVVLGVWGVCALGVGGVGLVGVEGGGLFNLRVDFCGATLLYSEGGLVLLLCGGALMLSLFVVLELTRGLSSGGVRAL